MNSFTFSSDTHRRYTLALIFLVFLPAIGLFVFGIFLEPLYGDLTRVGSYAERDFGWEQPQLDFEKPLYKSDGYHKYHDVVVLGDSFSRVWPLKQWQNYLIAATGWSVVTLDINHIKWEQVLKNRVFIETPPKYLILESVEREFPGRIKDWHACEASEISKQPTLPLPLLPRPVHIADLRQFAKYVERKKDWNNIKLGFVVNYLLNGAWRRAIGTELTDTRRVNLSSGVVPFSSANKREMLVYKDDFEKAPLWDEMDLLAAGCKMNEVRKKVEANGRTQLIVMVAPDKLTAYSDLVDRHDGSLRHGGMLAKLSEQHPEVIPRLDLALRSAIRDGEQDVYLPDDTHWGSTGHRIAAETLLGFLRVRE